MRSQFWLGLGVLAAVALCTGAWLGAAPERSPGTARAEGFARLGEWFAVDEEPAVLVLLVGNRAGVEGVRRAVDAERVLAATPDAVVLREGRVIATGPEAVGAPLTELGWVERPIEIWSARAPGDSDTARSDADGDIASRPGGGGERAELSELARKETLTLGETLRALALLDGA